MGEFKLSVSGTDINKAVDCVINQKFLKKDVTLASFGTKAVDSEYDLSEIVPNDNHTYRLHLKYRCRTNTTKDAYFAMYISTNAQSINALACQNQVEGSRQQQIGTGFITLGANERSLKTLHYSGTHGDYELIVSGYERLD